MFRQGQDIRPQPHLRHQISLEELLQLRFFPPARYPSKQQLAIRVGAHTSAARGRGMEFDDIRLYQPGDDIRHIDWRLMARTGQAHTKLFSEERERPVAVLCDLRPSMYFATRGHFKAVLSAYAASMVLWSALNHGDRAGGLILNTQLHGFKPSGRAKTASQMMSLMSDSHRFTTQEPTPSFGSALDWIDQQISSGSLVYIFSDFHDLSTEMANRLMHLSARRELKLVWLTDELEETLPTTGRFTFQGYSTEEGQSRSISLQSSTQQLKDYQQNFANKQELFVALNHLENIEYAHWRTNDHPLFMTPSVTQESASLGDQSK